MVNKIKEGFKMWEAESNEGCAWWAPCQMQTVWALSEKLEPGLF